MRASSLMRISINAIIGTGIFSTPSSITSSVGSVGAALLLWVLGLALSFAGLSVWLEFGTMFPRSGGEKVYLEAVYKRPAFLATVVFASQAVFLGFTASGCVVFASNILVAADRKVTEWEERGIAILVIVSVTILHTFLPKWGVRLMNVLGSVKIIVLLFIVVVSALPPPKHVRSLTIRRRAGSCSAAACTAFRIPVRAIGMPLQGRRNPVALMRLRCSRFSTRLPDGRTRRTCSTKYAIPCAPYPSPAPCHSRSVGCCTSWPTLPTTRPRRQPRSPRVASPWPRTSPGQSLGARRLASSESSLRCRP